MNKQTSPYQKFEKWLEPGEIVIDSSRSDRYIKPPSIYKACIGIGLGILFAIINQGLIAFFFILPSLIIIILHLFIFLYYKLTPEHLITTRKVVIEYPSKSIKIKYYNQIFDVSVTELSETSNEQELFLLTDPYAKILKTGITINTVKPVRQVHKELRDAWLPASPYITLQKKLRDFSKEYKLEFSPKEWNFKNKIIITGELNNHPFFFKLSNIIDPKTLQIEIECKNEEKNYLMVRPEVQKDIVTKLVGMQDYKIGTEWFDNKYIIQSNHQPFIEYVLDDSILNSIDSNNNPLIGTFKMGTKKAMEKKAEIKIKEKQLLDEHLLGEVEENRIRTKNNLSFLSFNSDELKYTLDYEKLANDIILKIKTLVTLVDKINKYNDR